MWCFYSTPHRRFTQNLGLSPSGGKSFPQAEKQPPFCHQVWEESTLFSRRCLSCLYPCLVTLMVLKQTLRLSVVALPHCPCDWWTAWHSVSQYPARVLSVPFWPSDCFLSDSCLPVDWSQKDWSDRYCIDTWPPPSARFFACFPVFPCTYYTAETALFLDIIVIFYCSVDIKLEVSGTVTRNGYAEPVSATIEQKI